MPTHTTYSRLVVLVCNFPNENRASEKESQIINGLKKRWAEEQNDPGYKRIHIIYLEKNDQPVNEKFEPIKLLDSHSKIYIVGHCKPGSDSIYSDPIYLDETNLSKLTYIKHGFSFIDIAFFIMHNLQNDQVIMERKPENLPALNSTKRKLRICFANCYAGTDEKDFFGKTINISFAQKFFDFVHNQHTSILSCEIIATNSIIVPVGTKPGFKNTFSFITNKTNNIEPGFHKLYLKHPYKGESFNFNFFNMVPSRKPSNDYKYLFIASSSTTLNEFLDGEIKFKKLDVKEIKEYKERQNPVSIFDNDNNNQEPKLSSHEQNDVFGLGPEDLHTISEYDDELVEMVTLDNDKSSLRIM